MRRYFAESLTWSRDATVGVSGMVVGALGLIGPVALGAVTGHLEPGLAAAIGSLVMAGADEEETGGRQLAALLRRFAVGCAAMLCGVWLAGAAGWGGLIMVLVGTVAAVLGGFNRPVGQAAAQFVVFLLIAMNAGAHGVQPVAMTVLFALGAVWTAVLALGLAAARRARRRRRGLPPSAAPASPVPPLRQSFDRWSTSLRGIAGWQHAIRLAPCLAVAAGVNLVWPQHHGLWIALTAALVIRRETADLPVRTLQRAVGTGVGVVLGAALLAWQPTSWGLLVAIGLIAGLRPWLKAGNYLAYSAVMTPLMVLMMDFGQPPTWMVMVDRLAATALGCLLALASAGLLRRARDAWPTRSEPT